MPSPQVLTSPEDSEQSKVISRSAINGEDPAMPILPKQTEKDDFKDAPPSAKDLSHERKDLTSLQNPKSVAIVSPLLIGQYKVQDGQVVWSGQWGMGEAAFNGGLTSAFEMKSNMTDTSSMPLNPMVFHPAGGNRVLKRQANGSMDQHHPVYAGYQTDTSHEPPTHGRFNGFFQIQAIKGKIQTVSEKNVDIRFTQDLENENLYQVYGIGSNKFGLFHLQGTYSTTSGEMRAYKLYQPKVKAPTKPASKRGRTARASKPKRMVVVKTPAKTTTPASVTAKSVKKVATPKTPAAMLEPTVPLSHGRSQRKKIIPAYLREDLTSGADSAASLSGKLKKCADILKQLMAGQIAQPFLLPVDPVALNIPQYPKIITNPMDLGTVKLNLESGVYRDPLEFAGHVRLTFSNAMLFNRPEHTIHIWARKLSETFERKFKSLAKQHRTPADAAGSAGESMSEAGDDKKGRRGKKSGGKKRSKNSEIEMMKEQIEQMKAQIRMMHASGGNTPTGMTPTAQRDLTYEDLNRAMTFEEKRQLSKDINKLPEAKLGRVIQIINERVPLKPGQTPDDEIEIDINSFDTPTLRTLQAYVRSALSTKRRRMVKPKGSLSQLQRAREAGKATSERIQTVQKELQKLTGETSIPTAAAAPKKVKEDGASSSSGSSSDSSSDSESDSSDDELGFRKSPVLASAPSLSAMTQPKKDIVLPNVAKDEGSSEPVKVENKGAWSLLASSAESTSELQEKEHSASTDSSALWSAARSQVQQKQQREEEIAAQQHRLVEERERENAAKAEELGRHKLEKEEADRRRQEEAAREAEMQRERMRQAARLEREREEQSVNLDEQAMSMSSMEAEFGKSTSFLSST